MINYPSNGNIHYIFIEKIEGFLKNNESVIKFNCYKSSLNPDVVIGNKFII